MYVRFSPSLEQIIKFPNADRDQIHYNMAGWLTGCLSGRQMQSNILCSRRDMAMMPLGFCNCRVSTAYWKDYCFFLSLLCLALHWWNDGGRGEGTRHETGFSLAV